MTLPPLNALRAFEAAARHESISLAAQELNVSPGAVSRHVRLLEENLGVALFRRRARGIELTESGQFLLPVLSGAFEDIGSIARNAIDAKAAALRIFCTPVLAVKWLIPRLPLFEAKHPHLKINIYTLNIDAPLAGESDIVIAPEKYQKRGADIVTQPLFKTPQTPILAPSLLERCGPLQEPEDLAKFELLDGGPFQRCWQKWLATFNVRSVDVGAAHHFPTNYLAGCAAIQGRGVALLSPMLWLEELDSGQLVTPFDDLFSEYPNGPVSLGSARENWDKHTVVAFRQWAEEMAAVRRSELIRRGRVPESLLRHV